MKTVKLHIYAIKKSIQLIFKGQFIHYFIPGIVLSILFFLAYGGLNLTNNALGFLEKTPWVGKYLQSAVDTTFGWIYSGSLFIYQFIILTLFSPINTALSEKLDSVVTGRKFKITVGKFIWDLIRLLGIVIVGGFLYLMIFLLWLGISKAIGLSFLSPYVSIILLSFFTGFNSYDYSLERYNIGVLKSWNYAFKNPLTMILTGGIFTLIIMIPYIGMIIAPILVTMVGTLVYLKKEGIVQ